MIDSESAAATGQAEHHLCAPEVAAALGARLHASVVEPFSDLRDAAAAAGFQLTIESAFRGFDRQLSIWNRKATGQLTVRDSNARVVEIPALTRPELMFTILRWSALPGASRHHWGTDIDVYDLGAKPVGYEVDLVPAEVDAGGMFAPLHEWLDARIASGTAFGFFRPYDADRGGIAPERWHLSYYPVAAEYTRALTPSVLRSVVERADIELKTDILEHLDEIHARFVLNVNPAFA